MLSVFPQIRFLGPHACLAWLARPGSPGALGIMSLGPVVTADKSLIADKGEQRLYKGLL